VGIGDARDPDGDAERRRRLAFGREARSVASVRALALVPGLGKALGFLNGGRGPIDVRVVTRGGWPLVRADLWAEDADCLTWLFTRYPGECGPSADAMRAAAEYGTLPEDGRGPQAAEVIDVAGMNPGWYALIPGTDYLDAYDRASAAATALEAVIRPILPAGRLVVDWDAWQNGRGTVRLDLEPGGAAWMTVMVDYLVEQAGPELGGRG
jgi:hypothetical protein